MNNVTKMLVVLLVIGVVSGGLLAYISDWATPIIKENARLETERAVLEVHPGSTKQIKIDNAGFELYQVMNDQGDITGYAMPNEGTGFQGKVKIMMGVTPELDEITGLKVLDQVETPGLGAEIVKDYFTERFKAISTQPEIKSVKGKKPENPNEIEAITGATISSVAVVKIMNDGIKKVKDYLSTQEKKEGAK